MKVTKREVDEKHLEAVYTVEDIESKDIGEPSPEFIKFVSESPELQYINKLTIGRFMKRVRSRFSKT